jgi:hypothetical protein
VSLCPRNVECFGLSAERLSVVSFTTVESQSLYLLFHFSFMVSHDHGTVHSFNKRQQQHLSSIRYSEVFFIGT